MASGTEMMVASLFRAMGFNPQEFISKIDQFLTYVQGEMKKFTASANDIDARLTALQNGQDELRLMLKTLLAQTTSEDIEHVAIEYDYVNGRNTGNPGHSSECSGADHSDT